MSISKGGRPLWAGVTLSLPTLCCRTVGVHEWGPQWRQWWQLPPPPWQAPSSNPHIALHGQHNCPHLTVRKWKHRNLPQGWTQSRWRWDWNQGHSETKAHALASDSTPLSWQHGGACVIFPVFSEPHDKAEGTGSPLYHLSCYCPGKLWLFI